MTKKKDKEPNAYIRLEDYDNRMDMDIKGSEEQISLMFFNLFDESPAMFRVIMTCVMAYTEVIKNNAAKENEKNGKPTPIDRSEVN